MNQGRKLLSLSLGIILFLNTFIVSFNFNGVKAYGAKPDFSYSHFETLAHGINEDTPTLANQNTIKENGTFTFPMDSYNNSDISNFTYVMSYPLDAGKFVHLVVNRANDKANVKYIINSHEKYDEGNPASTKSDPAYLSSLMIYSNDVNAYLNYDKYPETDLNAADSNYYFNKTNTEAESTPSFSIVQETGFSFKYDNKTMHFLWDADGNFKFTTNQLKEGRIYDVELNLSGDTIKPTPEPSRVKLLTGLNKNTFKSEPFANSDTSNLMSDASLKFVDTIINQARPPMDENPGSDEVGLKISFDLPLSWDGSGYNTVDKNYNFNFVMDLTSTAGIDKGITRQIRIDDIMNVTTGSSAVIFTPDQEKFKLIGVQGKRVSIYLSELYAGTIYDKVQLGVSDEGDTGVETKNTSIDFGKVFTFPKYEVVDDGDRLNINLTPYEGYIGFYALFTGTSANNLRPSATREVKSTGQKVVSFPLSTDTAGSKYFYQIFFSPNKDFENLNSVNYDDYIYSQILELVSKGNENVIVPPSNFDVTEDDFTKIEGSDTEKELTMNMQWDIGYAKNIDQYFVDNPDGKLELVYDLNAFTDPDTTSSSEVVGKIKLDIWKDAKTGELMVQYTLLNGNDKNYIVNTKPEPLNFYYRADRDSNMYVADVDIVYRALKEGEPLQSDIYLHYPEIYFFTMDLAEINGEDIDFPASNFDSVTLNDDSGIVAPPPQDAKITNNVATFTDEGAKKDEVSLTTYWELDGKALREYLEKIYSRETLENVDADNPFKYGDMYFNVYISENEKFMRNTLNGLPYDLDISGDTRVNKTYPVTYNPNKDGGVVAMSDINGYTSYKINGKQALNTLRDDRTVRIANIKINDMEKISMINNGTEINRELKIDGLDINTKYYIYIDFVVDNNKKDTSINRLDGSILSPILAATTGDRKDQPNVDDITPPMPDVVVNEINSDYTVLSWDDIIMANSNGGYEDISYQVIRTTPNPISDSYLNTREPYKYSWDTFPGANTKKVGYEFTTSGSVMVYDGTNFSGTSANVTVIEKDGKVYFTDRTLSPNTLYFYYVRAVRTYNGKESYSTWDNVSVTTPNLKAPINLKILQESDAFAYDPKTEVILNFDAPVATLDALGTDLFLEYAVKAGSGTFSDGIRMNISDLKKYATELNNEGYRNFTYKISGLIPGVNYSFKVRLVDSKGGRSMYSNIVRTRTDFVQEDYDKEEDINDWTERLKDLIKEVMDDPAWTILEDADDYQLVYREDKLEGNSEQNRNSMFVLEPAKSGKENIYYIPAQSLEFLNKNNKGIKVIYENIEFILPANAVTEANSAYKALSDDLQREDILDFYLAVSVNGVNISKINSANAGTDRVSFYADLVGVEKPIKDWETGVYDELLKLLENDSVIGEYIDDIKDGIEDEDIPKEMQDTILKALKEMTYEVRETVEDGFYDNLSGNNNATVSKFEKPLSVSYIGEIDGDIAGYLYKNNIWVAKNSVKGGKITFTHDECGTFGFTKTKISLPNVEANKDLLSLITKHNLTDYFGNGNTFKANAPATNLMVVGTTARMLGAKVGEDPVKYLKSKGINTTNRNLNKDVNSEVVIYYITNIYAKKSGIDLNSYTISNHSSMSAMKNINKKYKKNIAVATEMGLNTNLELDGSNTLTVKEFLLIIQTLDSKINLN
ncbi:MAG: hypothetical protein ACK5LT_05525 [Lachnospirales bacterium]